MYIGNDAYKDKLKLDGYTIKLVPIQKLCNVDLYNIKAVYQLVTRKFFWHEMYANAFLNCKWCDFTKKSKFRTWNTLSLMSTCMKNTMTRLIIYGFYDYFSDEILSRISIDSHLTVSQYIFCHMIIHVCENK